MKTSLVDKIAGLINELEEDCQIGIIHVEKNLKEIIEDSSSSIFDDPEKNIYNKLDAYYNQIKKAREENRQNSFDNTRGAIYHLKQIIDGVYSISA